jgi:hypothetical protein
MRKTGIPENLYRHDPVIVREITRKSESWIRIPAFCLPSNTPGDCRHSAAVLGGMGDRRANQAVQCRADGPINQGTFALQHKL